MNLNQTVGIHKEFGPLKNTLRNIPQERRYQLPQFLAPRRRQQGIGVIWKVCTVFNSIV
jgi:hypothetical protein